MASPKLSVPSTLSRETVLFVRVPVVVEERRAQRMTEAARKFVEALAEAYDERRSADRTVSARRLNAELTMDFFNAVIDVLRARAEEPESSLDLLRESADQQRRQREATRALMQESMGTYAEFADFMFSYYWRNKEETESGSEE